MNPFSSTVRSAKNRDGMKYGPCLDPVLMRLTDPQGRWTASYLVHRMQHMATVCVLLPILAISLIISETFNQYDMSRPGCKIRRKAKTKLERRTVSLCCLYREGPKQTAAPREEGQRCRRHGPRRCYHECPAGINRG